MYDDLRDAIRAQLRNQKTFGRDELYKAVQSHGPYESFNAALKELEEQGMVAVDGDTIKHVESC